MKKSALSLIALLAFSANAFATETVLNRCVGYTPAYFVELIKIEQNGRVIYQVNLQGTVKTLNSASEAQEEFKKSCELVKSWE